jgi:PAS domain S-box-containing protein
MVVKEVETQDRQGTWHRLQVRPYRTLESKIDGAVIALVDITDLKRSARELTTARDDAIKIIETMPIPTLVIASDRRVQAANDSFCGLAQIERSEIEGRFLSELGDGEWNIPSLLTMLEAVLTQGVRFQDFEIEHDFTRIGHRSLVLNARETYMAGSGTQAALLAFEDLTVIKRAADQLKRAEEKYRGLLENAGDGILIVNKTGTIEFANDRAESMFGYSFGEMEREPYELLVPKQDLEAPSEDADSYGKRKDGTIFPIEISASPVKANSLLSTIIVRDISVRRQIENERLSVLGVEREARQEAEKANRIKDEFLATLSHELRTPLLAILSWAQILRLGVAEADKVRRAVAMIEKSAKDQAQLLDDLLDVARIQAGKLHLDLQEVNPADCISGALDSVRGLSDEKSIAIETEFDPAAGTISADPNRLRQVFWNLLTNAIRFTPHGGKIAIRMNRVKEGFHAWLRVQVEDNGSGIKPAFIPLLFTRFSQGDSSTTRVHGGLGLGLSIVRDVIEMHGGTVTAESPGDGRGAVFNISLPYRHIQLSNSKGARSLESLQTASEIAEIPANLSHIRVLLVDDQEDARDAFLTILESFGAQVRAAATAGEGFNALIEFKPDVLLCDIAMPGEDGFSLIRKIRALEPKQGGKVPAVALTAYAGAVNARRALAAKFDVHLAKPVDAVALSHVIAKLAT